MSVVLPTPLSPTTMSVKAEPRLATISHQTGELASSVRHILPDRDRSPPILWRYSTRHNSQRVVKAEGREDERSSLDLVNWRFLVKYDSLVLGNHVIG